MIVEFNYNGTKTIIQCQSNEKMKNICQSYINKIKVDKNNIYFSYDGKAGNQFNEELTFEEMVNSEDKKRNKMNILVFSNEFKDDNDNDNKIIKSKDIICPECKESIKMDIIDYKIILSDCKNKHKIENILLNEFEDIQKINISDIKCEICKKCNKGNSYNNIFYKCITCKKNICPLCKSNHDKLHKIIDYDNKNYICNIHNENYNSYCEKCKINLCTLCEVEHQSHKIQNLGSMIVNKDELIKKNKKLKEYIDEFNSNVKRLINILNEVIDKMNKYYKINEDIINNYDNKNRNYEILYNLNIIKNNNNIIEELKNINNDNSIINKFNNIFNIYKNMNINEINMIYENKGKDKEIKIFDEDFVKNNKNNCKIIYKEKEQELKEKINFGLFEKINDKLEIKLKGIMNVTNMSYMFYKCSSLSSLPDISKWNTSNVTDMRGMFSNCSSLSSLTDIYDFHI